MPSTPPTIEQRGPAFDLRWPQDGVHIRISRIYQGPRGEMHGEISVLYQSDLPANGSYYPRLVTESRYQLTSKRSRAEIARHCDIEFPDLAWSEFIETASISVLRRSRRGAEVLDLSEWRPPPDAASGYRLTPLLAEGHPNMVFGDGGVGKSMVALWLATMVTEGMQTPFECRSGNVLYLDWEMDAADAHGRLSMIADGMGLPGPPRLFYRRCAGRLVDDVEQLSETVASKDIALVIVDSAVPACGGNPNEPESVQMLFYGLRQLEVTSMILAHVSKASAGVGSLSSPYGSVFWSNLSRNVWQARKEQEVGEDSIVVTLWHRKTNVGALLAPVTLRITFAPRFSVERVSAAECLSLVGHDGSETHTPTRRAGLAERMAETLGDGAISSAELAEAIDANPASVRKAFSRRDDLFVRLPDGKWGLRIR